MTWIWVGLLAGSVVFVLYTYVGYPFALWALARLRPVPLRRRRPDEWPTVSITLAAYNEERTIRGTLERLLAVEYPADRRQILVVSDASTDRTDAIVEEYAARGIELVRLPRRSGKTAAENAAAPFLRGEIVVNTDASVWLDPHAVQRLVEAFGDPSVGVASGRDVSVAAGDDAENAGERGYVGYEMWVRGLETRVFGIVQASGCLYAVRRHLHVPPLPEALTRDFAAVARAKEAGLRAVSVEDALCYVPRTRSLRREYARKVRTMTRGLETVFHWRRLLNPLRHGRFAWMCFSHKVCRWLAPWALVTGAVAAAGLAAELPGLRPIVGVAALLGLLGLAGWAWPERRALPKWLAYLAYFVLVNVAALHSWVRFWKGRNAPAWTPTRREAAEATPP